MLTKSFLVHGSQQEAIMGYKPFMVSSVESKCDISTARLVMRGRIGFFRHTPKFYISAKTEKRDGGTRITLRIFPNFSFWLVLLFSVFAMAWALKTMLSNIVIGKTVRPMFLLIPLAIIILDVVELWWQTADCLDRLQKVATGRQEGSSSVPPKSK